MPFGGDDRERVPSHHLAVVLLPEGADREAVRDGAGETRHPDQRALPADPHLHAYRAESRRPLPRTDAVAERLLTLPLYGRMTDEQADAVVETLLQTL